MASYAPADKLSWDSSRTKCLIVEYKKYEHLYNPQHKLYRNKKTREETLRRIANALNVAWYGSGITCAIDDIKKKLNGLRSQYLFERQKIARAAAQGEAYNPTIYWYPMLKFLEPVTLNGASRATANDSSIIEYICAQTHAPDEPPEIKPDVGALGISNTQTQVAPTERHEYDDNSTSNADSPSTASSTSTQESYVDVQSYLQRDKPAAPAPKRQAEDANDPLFIPDAKRQLRATSPSSTTRQECLTRSELTDHLETFGKFIANELRGIYLSSNDVFLRRTKRQLQQVLIDAWTFIDMDESRYPGCTTDNRAQS